MMLRNRRSMVAFAMVIAGSIFVGLSLGLSLQKTLAGPNGPRIRLNSPSSLTLVAPDKTSGLTASYNLTNDGDQDLILGEVTTTCGCTLASINPKIVTPHSKATIKVNGEPPESGERDVHIKVTTNDRMNPHLDFELIMVGASPMPFIGHTSGPIQFGVVEQNEAEAIFFIDTHERIGDRTWSLGVRSNVTGLSIDQEKIQVITTTADKIIRRRSYRASYISDQPTNGSLGSILIFDRLNSTLPIHTIKVLGLVHSPVYSIPQGIYENFNGLNPAPIVRVSIHSSLGFDVEVTPIDSPYYDFQRIKTNKDKIEYDIVFKLEKITSTFTTDIVFSTNQPKFPTLKVPAVIQWTGKKLK